MALARSASGPGGLSINTNSANSLFRSSTTPAAGGMFGSTQANKPSTGLFGSTTASSAPQSGGLFGTATTQAQTGGLFGSSTATSQPQTGGLFGSTAATTQPSTGLFGSTQPQQSGGLFGNTNTQQPQTGGLFGNSTTSSQPQQAGGLFSGLGSQPAQNQNTGGGLFGASMSTQPNQGGGLFGGQNNQNQSKPAMSLFGGLGTTQNQPMPQPNQNQSQGLFGSTLSGGLSLGQGTNQQQNIVPGVRIDTANIRGTTRFNDLHEDLQKEICNIDAIIQAQIQLKNDCEAIMPSHNKQLAQVPTDVEFCQRKLRAWESAKDADLKAIKLGRQHISTDAEHAKLSFKAIDNLKLPPQYHNPSIWSSGSTPNDNRRPGEGEAQDIVGFFSTTTDELAATLSTYENHMLEIEQHLRGVESTSAAQMFALVSQSNGDFAGPEDPMEQLAGALRDFEEGVLTVAGKVGGVREGVQNLQLGNWNPPRNSIQNGPRSGVY